MRAIKFRGKVFNIWVYGHYLPWHSVKDENGKDVYAQIFVDDGRHSKQNIVGAHTVGQYIGLKDKNGVEIYEGDIVKIRGAFGACEDAITVVKYHETHCQFVLHCPEKSYDFMFVDNMGIGKFTNGIEVIGNIYDKPELLEDK